MTEDGHYQAFVRLRSTSGEWLVDPELRPRIVADAEEHDSNVTDVVLAILAKRYKVACEPNGRRTAADPGGEELNLRLPMPLYQRIAAAAAERHPWSVPDEIRAALCAHYEFAVPEAAKRGRRAAA